MPSRPLRLGIFGVAHMHCWSYVHSFKNSSEVQLVGFFERDEKRGAHFEKDAGAARFAEAESLLAQCDIAAVCSENVFHKEFVLAAARAGVHVLSEKPLATTVADGEEMVQAARSAKINLMTAFPCRFSPAYQSLKRRVQNGDIGKILALRTTNRGRCPFDWFVEKELSGGGAMIDHTVHVADLLFDLLGEEPVQVTAQIGSNRYGQEWEDTAMLCLDYKSGCFATLDSSWSRPQNFKTWGDVTLSVIGETGTLSIDLFNQAFQVYKDAESYGLAGYGSDTDRLMIQEFLNSVLEQRDPAVTGEHGLAAVKVALAGYESLARTKKVSMA